MNVDEESRFYVMTFVQIANSYHYLVTISARLGPRGHVLLSYWAGVKL